MTSTSSPRCAGESRKVTSHANREQHFQRSFQSPNQSAQRPCALGRAKRSRSSFDDGVGEHRQRNLVFASRRGTFLRGIVRETHVRGTHVFAEHLFANHLFATHWLTTHFFARHFFVGDRLTFASLSLAAKPTLDASFFRSHTLARHSQEHVSQEGLVGAIRKVSKHRSEPRIQDFERVPCEHFVFFVPRPSDP